jgi:hypothetical protein
MFGNALEQAVLNKGKGPLQQMYNTLSTVLAKGKEGFEKLFDSVDFRPLAQGLSEFFSVFDQSGEAGEQMKSGIGGALNGLIKDLGNAALDAEIFFLKIEIWAMRNKGTIKEMWESGLATGKMFLNIAEGAAAVLGKLAGLVIKVGEGMGWILDKTGLLDLSVAAPDSKEVTERKLAASRSGLATAPAHASGGLVMQPAAGETFASVAPGEMILPRAESSRYSAVANDNAPQPAASTSLTGGVRVDRIDVHIEAAQGVTDAHQLSVTGLTLAMERMQLAVGR